MKRSVVLLSLLTILLSSASFSLAEERIIHVFVALCDNATQGIVKVNPRIGDGDKPHDNLYWGCADSIKPLFKKSANWTLVKEEKALSPIVLERVTFQHKTFKDVTLVADAYRGANMKRCLTDFFSASGDDRPESRATKLVVFIGHNGLMDHPTLPLATSIGKRDAIVLACLSNDHFAAPLKVQQGNPILMTRSLMYPGAFILHDTLEGWLRNESKTKLRERAAAAYAKNQGISVKSARRIFAELEE